MYFVITHILNYEKDNPNHSNNSDAECMLDESE